MKKYLMIGIAAVAMTAAFTSCSKNNDIEQISKGQEAEASFKANFEKRYGQIDPQNDWGFGKTASVRTRTADPRGNMWYDSNQLNYVEPAPIGSAELEKVLTVFNQRGAESYESLIDWSTFFVQQVYKGVAVHPAKDGLNSYIGSNQMNWLFADDGTHTMNDHINNFNAGDNKDYNGIMLMEKSSTKAFGYNCSSDNGRLFYNFRMEEIDGNYYVGFDFEAAGQNLNEQVERDYIYNDWIVKIVPARPNITYEARIICEDLGATDDFDFNDVVFDVKIDKNKNKTYIKLLAAGGTIPLYIGDTDHEVHDLFGVDTGVMVNTYNTGEKAPVEFELNRAYENYNAIPVMINLDEATALGEGNLTVLKAEMGAAPQKILVDTDYVWCGERLQIETVYPNFIQYVSSHNYSRWW
jgi:hypothetical protein